LALAATAARGESASESAACSAEALGTARVLPIEAATTPRVGRKHFHDTLPLAPKEVVLTFDDGPAPGTTARVLETLKARMRAGIVLFAGTQCARASAARPPGVERGSYRRPPHVFASAAQPHAVRGRRGRDRSRFCRGRHRALWPFRAHSEDAVLSFSRICLLASPARSIGTARNRGFWRRSMGKRLDPDVAAGRAQPCPCPRGSPAGRNRAGPRYQGADRAHARRLSARAEKPRLPPRARRSGSGALSPAARRFLGAHARRHRRHKSAPTAALKGSLNCRPLLFRCSEGRDSPSGPAFFHSWSKSR